jgi:hypothetical protein
MHTGHPPLVAGRQRDRIIWGCVPREPRFVKGKSLLKKMWIEGGGLSFDAKKHEVAGEMATHSRRIRVLFR